MGSPAIPDPMLDQISSITEPSFSQRKGSKKSVKAIRGKASKPKSLVSMKKMSKRRPK